MVGSVETLTYRELVERCAEVAAGLRGLHLHRDDRIVIVMNDDVPMITSIFGVFRAGFVAIPVSTMLGTNEIREIVKDSAADALIISAEYAATVADATADCPDVDHIIVDGDPDLALEWGVDVLSYDELVQRGRAAPAEMREVADTVEDEWALWLYTSGTTGKPKGAMHRHENVKASGSTFPPHVMALRPEDRCLSIAKMFFSYGIGNSIFHPLAAGATTILEPRRPTPEVFSERLRRDRPTIFDAVPTFYAQLLDADLPRTRSHRYACASAGEPLPMPLQQRFTDRFKVPVLDGIGCTEFLNTFLSNTWLDVKPARPANRFPRTRSSCVDPDGKVVPRGEPGTMWVRGPSMAIGYWKRVATSRQVFVGEWCNTGDTFMQDDEGYYVCMGRTNDLIKAGGIYVSPGEVEDRLLRHQAVAEVAVVGLPDEDGLHKPVAFVVARADTTEDELIQWCRDGMPAFKRPRRVVFVDELPKTATGKMQRFKLREQLELLDPLGPGFPAASWRFPRPPRAYPFPRSSPVRGSLPPQDKHTTPNSRKGRLAVLDGMPLVDAHTHVPLLPTLGDSWRHWTYKFGRPGSHRGGWGADGVPRPERLRTSSASKASTSRCSSASTAPSRPGSRSSTSCCPWSTTTRRCSARSPTSTRTCTFPLAKELKRQLEHGAAALKLHPVHGGFRPDETALYAAYAILEERQIP